MTRGIPQIALGLCASAWLFTAWFILASPIMPSVVALTFWLASLGALATLAVISSVMWLRS